VKYFGALSGKHMGSTPSVRAQVDQWISFTNTTLVPTASKVLTGIFGWGEITQNDWNEAAKQQKADIKVLNTALEGKKWLCGDEMTLADIYVAAALQTSFQTVLDGGFRKAMKNVGTWVESVYALPAYRSVHGNLKLSAKPLKPVCVQEQKKEEKKAAAPAPKKEEKQEEKKEEKVLDNVASLPPTNFDLFNFKTFFVNHEDKKGVAVDEFYKILDWEGWAFWRLEYDIYEGEGAKEHITCNLMGGFLNRAEHTSKYTFGRHAVLGEEPNLQIRGCWLMRGTVLPDGLVKEHPQFEYYKTRKLDPRNNKEDDALIRAWFGGQNGDVIEGLKVVSIRW